MPLTTRKKTFKKAGASIEEELPETRYGKIMGKFATKEMEELFRMIKGREERLIMMTHAIEENIPLRKLIDKLKKQKKELR